MNGLLEKDPLGAVTANRGLLAQALKARQQPRPQVTPQGLLDATALGLSPVPVLGDILGLGADASRFVNEPESRTPLNFGLAALGAIPFVPSAGILRRAVKPDTPDIEFSHLGNGYFQAKAGDREIGVASLSDNGNYLTSVRVDPEFQRQGIGGRFYNFIEKTIGAPLMPSPTNQTPAGKAFWNKRMAPISAQQNLLLKHIEDQSKNSFDGFVNLNSIKSGGSDAINELINKGLLIEADGFVKMGRKP